MHSLESNRLGLGDASTESSLGEAVLRKLSMRALFLCEDDDVVLVNEEPSAEWIEYLNSIGLGSSQIIIAETHSGTLAESLIEDQSVIDRLKRLIASGSYSLAPYMGSESVMHVAELLGIRCQSPSVELLDRLNHKVNLESVLTECSLPTIRAWYTGQRGLRKQCESLFDEYGQLIIRSDLSIGGHGVWSIKSAEDIPALVESTARSHSQQQFVIQPLLEVVNSPNVQYEILDEGARLIGISDQTMTEQFAFGGNTYPSVSADNEQMIEQAGVLVEWLRNIGYRGMVGIDFIIQPSGDAFIIEINPRVNTSTFPLVLADTLGRTAFELCTGLQVPDSDAVDWIEILARNQLLYTKDQREGVIPLMLPSKDRLVLDAMIFSDRISDIEQIRSRLLEIVADTNQFEGSRT